MTQMQRRVAFTLIELLVVMAIMIVLLAITAAVAFSGAFNSQKVVHASDRASGWLLIAKNRAKRDGVPRGVRFLRDPANLTQVTEAQYIEAPEQWAPNPNQELNPSGPRIMFAYTQHKQPPPVNPLYPAVQFRQVFFVSNVAADLAEFDQRVTPGDMLILPEIGGPYRIVSISTTSPLNSAPTDQQVHTGVPIPGGFFLHRNPGNANDNARELILASYPDLGALHSPTPTGPPVPRETTLTTYKFAIQPQPRPLLGEPLLQLTGTTVIDFAAVGQPTTTVGVTMDPTGHFDILFSPSGQVLNNPNGLICLWVRDPEKLQGNPRLPNDSAGYDLAGEQILVTIYTRTGFIATHPISTLGFGPGYDPWLFAKDGVNSGF